MELRPRPGVSGLPVKPRATFLDRKSVGLNEVDDVTNETLVNPPSSATGITRGGKSPSRILPAEGGRIRTSSPQPRSESAGGADRSPEGDPPHRRGQTRESGGAGGRATPVRLPLAVAAIGGKPTQHPGEGAEFTMVSKVESLTRGSDTSPPTSARRESADNDASLSTMPTFGVDLQTQYVATHTNVISS